jgi:hypothetical protein
MSPDIPTEVYVAFLDRTFELHWDYHAMLMTGVWFLLVPIGVIAARFFKPKPTTYGIEKGTGRLNAKLRWWTIHYVILYMAIGLALVGMATATLASGGFSGSMHAFLGFGTILFGSLQIFSAWLRGSHGGKHGADSDPDDPSTWRGDHFDMTPRRRWFEAYHKSTGYFTIILALAAVASGLQQFWVPQIAIAVILLLAASLIAYVLMEGKGYRQDTYRSVYGNHPDNPYNKYRERL